MNDLLADISRPDHPLHAKPEPCGHLAAAAVEAVTGDAIGYRYSTAGEAKRTIVRNGGSLEAAVDKKLTPLEAPAFAQRGDIIMDVDGNLAVAFGKFALALGTGPDDQPTLVRVPMHFWRKGWRVG